ncbi:MAG: hypothetical protein KDK36_13975 [Leptospiraceae bacterium]|nr:hypothetical protein [Leptospiraceae bacterium]
MPGKLLLTLFLLWHLAIFGEDKTIDVVVSYPSPNYLKVLSGLKYRVDSEISIHYLKDYMKKSNTDSNELILTIGNQATNYIRKNYNKKNNFCFS